jgi:hypothetical protein
MLAAFWEVVVSLGRVNVLKGRFLAKFSICWSGLHLPAKSASNEKRMLLCSTDRSLLNQNVCQFKTTIRSKVNPHASPEPVCSQGRLTARVVR